MRRAWRPEVDRRSQHCGRPSRGPSVSQKLDTSFQVRIAGGKHCPGGPAWIPLQWQAHRQPWPSAPGCEGWLLRNKDPKRSYQNSFADHERPIRALMTLLARVSRSGLRTLGGGTERQRTRAWRELCLPSSGFFALHPGSSTLPLRAGETRVVSGPCLSSSPINQFITFYRKTLRSSRAIARERLRACSRTHFCRHRRAW